MNLIWLKPEVRLQQSLSQKKDPGMPNLPDIMIALDMRIVKKTESKLSS